MLLGIAPARVEASTQRLRRYAPQGYRNFVARDLGGADTEIETTQRDEHTGVRAIGDTVRAANALADTLAGSLHALPGWRPLVVGGDCSILLGIFPALRRQRGPSALWFLDGHPDYLDGRTSDTGETADMDLPVLTGDGAAPLVTLAGAPPMVAVSDAVLFGYRSQNLDEGSAAELRGCRPICAGSMRLPSSVIPSEQVRTRLRC